MAALFKNKKILYDGEEFVFFEREKIRRVEKDDFSYKNGKVELIITENLYHLEPIDDKAIKGFDREEIRRYIEWKADAKGVKSPLLTYSKLGNSIFGFIFPEGQSFIKEYFNGKVSGIKTFALSVYNRMRAGLEENSLLIIDYKNLFIFLVIGKDSPVFIRKKMNLSEDEIIEEAGITVKFISERFGFDIDKIYSRIEIPDERIVMIKEDFIAGILK